jgi:hypothetical protein
MTPYKLDSRAWQESWDRQQEAFMPDREHRFAAMRDWWDRAALDPVLAPLVEQRHRIYSERHSGEWTPPVSWHVSALQAAGFAEIGVVWRGGTDAAVAAIRHA